jgi:hypothetical protein
MNNAQCKYILTCFISYSLEGFRVSQTTRARRPCQLLTVGRVGEIVTFLTRRNWVNLLVFDTMRRTYISSEKKLQRARTGWQVLQYTCKVVGAVVLAGLDNSLTRRNIYARRQQISFEENFGFFSMGDFGADTYPAGASLLDCNLV